MTFRATVAAFVLTVFTASAFAQTGSLTVQADHPSHPISPMLYGLMTEEINHSYDGGLYAELIQNRAFKDSDTRAVHWSLVQSSGGKGAIALETMSPLSPALQTYLRLTISQADQGQRVVTGQRIMQGQRDAFLGWTQDHCTDQYCYVRQLQDARLAMTVSDVADAALPCYAALCGSTLARAHARSGDAARIAGYMGSGGAFDAAIAEFAVSYADQVERDWRLFVEAIKVGVIEARDE